MRQIPFVLGFLLWIYFFSLVESKECLKNEDIGKRPGNVYTCEDPDYPRCCEVNNDFTCCEPTSNKVVREQLTLWGAVLVVVFAIVVVVTCFRKDIYCFESDTLKESIRSVCGRRKKRSDKYAGGKCEDKKRLVKVKGFNGIANLGEPDADEYIRNYLIPQTCGVHTFHDAPYKFSGNRHF